MGAGVNTHGEDLHPRGQAVNAGQFRTKANDAPTQGLSGTADDYAGRGPLWCTNLNPHGEHSTRNQVGGTDYCSGRPDPADPATYLPTPSDQDGTARAAAYRADHPATASEQAAADDAIATFIRKRGITPAFADGEEPPVVTLGYALGDQVAYEAIRELLVDAQRAALSEARKSAIRAAAGLWGPTTKVPSFDELESGISGPNAHAVEYLRGQVETIADTFGAGQVADAHHVIYDEIRAAAGEL
ncbi:hypothetical protein HMPREF1529_02274 [Microbacterium sp. oral taxon 186 str. F0373]|nr:hypothetical protein HMPREF1529_02274 [Microbacterium sp. oral taxon 186 str. F0373]